MGRVVHGVSCPWGELSWGELSIGRVVHGASCPWGELFLGQVVHGASCRGVSFDGASCLWGELSWGEWSGNRVTICIWTTFLKLKFTKSLKKYLILNHFV